jgi:hypothetical protein
MNKKETNIPSSIKGYILPETVIYTKKGPKTIEVIKEGDEVISIDGKYHKVTKVFEKEIKEEIIEIKGMFTLENLKCTKYFQIPVIRDENIICKNAEDLKENEDMHYPTSSFRDEKEDEDLLSIHSMLLYG